MIWTHQVVSPTVQRSQLLSCLRSRDPSSPYQLSPSPPSASASNDILCVHCGMAGRPSSRVWKCCGEAKGSRPQACCGNSSGLDRVPWCSLYKTILKLHYSQVHWIEEDSSLHYAHVTTSRFGLSHFMAEEYNSKMHCVFRVYLNALP